ncbi:MAG TPA: helix-turn-helix transcriptional regulator [Candidatus Acidoferrales bacterium]|nr:helix-turn-helix transcriptional regulator [Candidatus Acidoferrales bacterium]
MLIRLGSIVIGKGVATPLQIASKSRLWVCWAQQKKMSLYRLRQITGVTYPTLLKLSHNKAQMFDAQVLDKLCRALRCKPGNLLVWKPERYPRLRKKFQKR